jgi:hypothetical protein
MEKTPNSSAPTLKLVNGPAHAGRDNLHDGSGFWEKAMTHDTSTVQPLQHEFWGRTRKRPTWI